MRTIRLVSTTACAPNHLFRVARRRISSARQTNQSSKQQHKHQDQQQQTQTQTPRTYRQVETFACPWRLSIGNIPAELILIPAPCRPREAPIGPGSGREPKKRAAISCAPACSPLCLALCLLCLPPAWSGKHKLQTRLFSDLCSGRHSNRGGALLPDWLALQLSSRH